MKTRTAWLVVTVVAMATACGAPHSVGAPPVSVAPVPKRSEPSRFSVLPPEASAIDAAMMARYPEPGWNVPRAVKVAPDGDSVTYLASENASETMALFAYQRSTGATSVLLRSSDLPHAAQPMSREEELRRERQRQRGEGITSYQWAKRAPVMLVPHGGDLFLRGEAGAVTRLTQTEEPEIDAKLCDDGTRVAYVRRGELYVLELKTRRETQLTRGAVDGVTHGLSDFNGQEEFGEPSGFFWSPSCTQIAYLEVDERNVGTVPVVGYRDGREETMSQRYPLAGARNPRVTLRLVDVRTKTSRLVRFKTDEERYLGRFAWSENGAHLFLEALSRDQKRLSYVRVDARTADATELWNESQPTWVELSLMRHLPSREELLVTTNMGGHLHLEARSARTGAPLRALTGGPWDVTSIVAVDTARGSVLFTATAQGPRERHLYSVPLEGGPVTRLTKERGVHAITSDEKGAVWIDLHSATDRLPRAEIVVEGRSIGELPVPREPYLETLALRPTEAVHIKSPGGVLLEGALLRPRHVVPGAKHPAIVMVYGGPGAQTVFDSWSPRLLWQHLADRGFFVLQVDNRGSGGRGPAFETEVHKRLGELELADQLAGADYLASLPEVDPSRLGIYGHSYGGFMAALAMLKAPGRFAVGIAGSPVTDWRLYDASYTERFMETPENNPEGYAASTLASFAKELQGRLFLIHALMDENVHFAHTARLIDALVAAKKPFDMFVFPGERHGYRRPEARAYAYSHIARYFADYL
jgi:dipeptidyl-peptidase-4